MRRFHFYLLALMGLIALSTATFGLIALRAREPYDQAALWRVTANRVGKAQQMWEMSIPYYQTGQMSIDRPYQASLALLESRRAASSDDPARIVALTAHRDRMRLLVVEAERAENLMGNSVRHDLPIAEYYLSEAEYWLAEAKSGR